MERSLESVLLEYSQDKLIVVDETGDLRYASAAIERILGYDPDDIVGSNAFDLVHPDDLDETRSIFDRVISAPEPTTETHRYRVARADGGYVWLESRFSNVTDDAIGGYVISSRDVTEQRAAERDRELAEERLSEIAGTVGDVLWMFSPDWTELLFVNPAYEPVFGAPVEALREDPSRFLEAIHPKDRHAVREAMARISAGESVELEYRVNPTRNYDRWVWVQGDPIEVDGEVVRVVGFARDVTDRRRRERQLTVMDNLLRHNLRNDMSVVIGNAEIIEAEGSEPTAGRAEIIRTRGEALIESADKQREIIQLLTSPTMPVSIDVDSLVREAVDDVRERHPGASIAVESEGSVTVPGLDELRLAVAELLENAIEHDHSDQPHVSVTTRTGTSTVDIVVEDDCEPIPEIEYRVLTGEWAMDDIYHTSGLGLWLVYWIVDLCDGEITFAQHEPTGNTIRIRLPRVDGVA